MLHNVVLRLSKQQTSNFALLPKHNIEGCFDTVFDESNDTLCDKNNVNPVQTDLASLSIKVDQLIETVKELKVSSFGPKDGKPVLRQAAMDFQVQNVDDWKDIKNILIWLMKSL